MAESGLLDRVTDVEAQQLGLAPSSEYLVVHHVTLSSNYPGMCRWQAIRCTATNLQISQIYLEYVPAKNGNSKVAVTPGVGTSWFNSKQHRRKKKEQHTIFGLDAKARNTLLRHR